MIIYQVYPRSFADSNQDGIGDLRGITEKLDYISELGAECVWISPFFKSPMKDFGYDVSDYCAIDPMFGTMDDFDRLIAKSRELKIDVMLDLVLSHTSDKHPWFTESRSSRENPKADWYVWTDPKPGGGPPNNWQSLFGAGGAWEWDETRRQFYLHNFLREQPDLNFHNHDVQRALLDACRFWFDKGVRGLRLDVCNFYFHSAGLEDNPLRPASSGKTEGVHDKNPYNAQLHVYDKDRPENLSFLKKLRGLADSYPGTVLMGEIVSDDSPKIMREYINDNQPLHTAYNFSLFQPRFDAHAMAEMLTRFEEQVANGTPSWALGNHDVPRYVSRFGAEQSRPRSAECFLTFLFLLRGNIILYQGDELGLSEADIPRELMQDPFGIAFYPEFKGRDGCRTPLPWRSQQPSGKTWLPIPPEHLPFSVESQQDDSDSILQFTRRLISWRKARPWLNDAKLTARAESSSRLIIERLGGSGQHLVGIIDLNSYEFHLEEKPSKI